MKFAVLAYQKSGNYGDEIQSIAAGRLLPRVDLAIPREQLRDFQSEKQVILLFNGWHGTGTQFPPAECITPIYVGFHIAEGTAEYFTRPECIAHFRQHAPIGCRDRGTMEILRAAGVDAFYSKCLTLTLPKRESSGEQKEIAFVDIPHWRDVCNLMGFKKSMVASISHSHKIDILDGVRSNIKKGMAEMLLLSYKGAALVITSRLHCVLPCAAMGVPVLYFGKREYRTEIIADIGITMHPPIGKIVSVQAKFNKNFGFGTDIPNTGETVDLESEKAAIIAAVKDKLARLQ